MRVTLYHNPQCSNSRKALDTIRAHGVEPHIIEYLKTPPSRDELAALIAQMRVSVREIMRSKEAPYAELNLADADDDVLLDALAAHPVLLNRPIVVTAKGAKLCRPGDLAATLL